MHFNVFCFFGEIIGTEYRLVLHRPQRVGPVVLQFLRVIVGLLVLGQALQRVESSSSAKFVNMIDEFVRIIKFHTALLALMRVIFDSEVRNRHRNIIISNKILEKYTSSLTLNRSPKLMVIHLKPPKWTYYMIDLT